MEKSYKTFVTDLRKLLLAAMDLKEEEIYFSNDGEKYGCLGDRLFVESGHMEKAKTVCGLHTEVEKKVCFLPSHNLSDHPNHIAHNFH